MRLLLLLGAATAVLLAAGRLSSPPPPVFVELPAAGATATAELPDGTPVFVVHREGGDVRVFAAESPQRLGGLRSLVAWCGRGAFTDWSALRAPRPVDAVAGFLAEYRLAPAPKGEVGVVGPPRVGAPSAAAPSAAAEQQVTTVARCDPRVAVGHRGAPGTVIFRDGQRPRWCPNAPPPPATTCGPRGRTIAAPPLDDVPGDRTVWRYDGLVRHSERGDGTADVVLVTGGSHLTLLPDGGAERIFGWVREVVPHEGGARLHVDQVVVFVDAFHPPVPLDFLEPVPGGWRMTDRDGEVLRVLDVRDLRAPRELEGQLLEFVLRRDETVFSYRSLPGRPETSSAG